MNESVVVKSDLANEIYNQLGLNQRESREFVDNFFEEIRCILEKHEEVKLAGFGNYRTRHKAARPGRNPKTGTEASISERCVVTFKASSKLRKRVNQYNY